MPQYPATSEDTVLYQDKQFIAAEDITLRVIDEAIASIYGRVFLNGVEIFPTGVGGVSDGDKGDITVSVGGTVWVIDNGVVTNAKLADPNLKDLALRWTPASASAPASLGFYEETDNGTRKISISGQPDLPGGADSIAYIPSLFSDDVLTVCFSAQVLRNKTLETDTNIIRAPVGSQTGKYLKDDGTWATPPGGGGLTDGDKGDITVGSGGTTLTIDSQAVTNGKLNDMAANTIKARQTSIGSPQDLSAPTIRTMLSIDNVSNTSDANKPVSTAQQTALNAKVDKARTITQKTGGANTALLTDDGCYLRFTQSGTVFTIPPNSTVAFPIGATIEGTDIAGAMTVAQGAAVTINKARTFVTAGAFSGWSIIKVATDTWDLHGDFV
jgi:hypothetical protein